ncbi:PEP-CTERM protein-sorting domain-containing protein [Nitrosospira sp. Nl5]|uniref:SGNH/GDSL hydrolase family protein n=1 Tax=Nitrosospira sp. Nl5 TaxID=200120 RepID=UPI00088D0FD1|nr:SGNH/GDSL hydrolase family protein [Nitrosospira sp. Nl5]SCY01734.1 PEP-CTERM protein-sorting domain-containing protein [Nitrosospira sp. Nl5]
MKTRVLFVALFALLTGGSVSAAPFGSLYAFGDSLSDVGSSPSAEMSIYKILANNCDPSHSCPPYFEGRISNGPVATEYLAGSLFPGGVTSANFHSYAVGGSTTGIGNIGDGGTATEPGDLLPIPVPGIFPLPGMKGELEQYMEDSGGHADSNALYFVWGGGNDYLTNDSPIMAARNVSGYVGELAAAGAKHILVPNLGDLGQTPFARTQGDAVQTQAQAFSLSFNEELASQLGTLSAQFPTTDIFQFDTYSFLNGVIADPLSYGFTDVQNACLAVSCTDPGSFLYWDDFHPTTYAHSVIASGLAAAVPEPGIFAMFIGGLFVLGIAASRRREVEQPCNLVGQIA